MATARTRLMHDGVRHDAFLLIARDRAAARSYVGVFDAESECGVGDMMEFRRLDGVVDEAFLTDTDLAGGETLLVAGSYPRSRAPADGVLDWRAFQLGEARALWQLRVPTAAFLRRHERGSVSGSRDLALRNHDGYVLSIRQPRAERLWFTWSGGHFQEASGP